MLERNFLAVSEADWTVWFFYFERVAQRKLESFREHTRPQSIGFGKISADAKRIEYYNFSNLHLAMQQRRERRMCQVKYEYPDMHRVERAPYHKILYRQDLLYSLRGSRLSSLRRLVRSLGAREGAREGALEGALDGALDGAWEGALDGALDGAVPLDTRDFAFDAVSSSSSGGAASNLGARLGASDGSRCLSGRYVNVRKSLTVSASS